MDPTDQTTLTQAEQIKKILMEPSREGALMSFVHGAWPHMGDPNQLAPTKYMQVVCETLQQVALREIPDLIVNIPPNHTKSVLCNIMLPAWIWTWEPTHRFIFLSYNEQLVYRDALKCRALIKSKWYQDRWPLQFKADTDNKGYYINEKGGSRWSCTIRSGVTGSHADTIVVDDPQNPEKLSLDDASEAVAESEKARHVWDNILPSRYVNQQTFRRIVVMQRLSQNDLTQHVIDTGHVHEHLCLPLRYDPEHDYVSDRDWRTEPGQLLAPERYDEDTLAATVDKMPAATQAAQFRQDPSATGAGTFDLDDFRYYASLDDLPDEGVLTVSIDGATSGVAKGTAAKAIARRSRWAFTAYLRANGCSYLIAQDAFRADLDVVLERLQTFLDGVIQDARTQPKGRRRTWYPSTIIVEKKSTGEAATSFFKHLNLHGFTYDLQGVSVSKEERAAAALPEIRAHKVYLPESFKTAETGTLALLKSELKKFPRGRSDDLVDTLTQMLLYWVAKENRGDSRSELKNFAKALQKRINSRHIFG